MLYAYLGALLALTAQTETDSSKEPAQPSWPSYETTVGFWNIFSLSDSPMCAMIATYTKNDEFFGLVWDAKAKTASITFSNANAISLADGDQRDLEIMFVRGGKLDDGWGKQPFVVSVLKDGKRRLTSRSLDEQLLTDFSTGHTIGLFTGKEIVGSFALDDSAAAVKELKRCAMKVAGINPLDPFAK